MGREATEGDITWFFLELKEIISDCLKGDFWTTTSLILQQQIFSSHKMCGVCSVEHLLLFGHVTEIYTRTLAPVHLKDKKWTSVSSFHPCQGHFGNACNAKDVWIKAVVTWLIVHPASPCVCGLVRVPALRASFHTCRMLMGLQVTVAASERYPVMRGGDGEYLKCCLWSMWLCRMLGSTSVLVLDITSVLCSACCALSSFSWDRCAQPFRKAINRFTANKFLAGTGHVSGAGVRESRQNGGEVVFFCLLNPKPFCNCISKAQEEHKPVVFA